MLRTFILIAAIFGCCIVPAIAQNKADRKDEQRENDRVKDAKQSVQKAERELSASIKEYRRHYAEVQQAERKLLAFQSAYSRAREAAEERLEDSSGLPEAIKKMRSLRDTIAVLSKPVIEQMHTTDRWKVADRKSGEAQMAREKLLGDDSRTDEELAEQLESLEKQIAAPEAMDAAAIDADPRIKQLKIEYHQSLDKIADLRRKIDTSKVDGDEQVKVAKDAVDAGQAQVAAMRKSLVSRNAQVAKNQSALVGANRKLQQAQAADQNDRNQAKPKKKK